MKHTYKFRPKFLYCVVLTLVIFCTVTLKTAANGVGVKMFYSPLTIEQEPVPVRVIRDTPPKLQVIASDTTRRFRNDSIELINTTDTFTLKLSQDSLAAPI